MTYGHDIYAKYIELGTNRNQEGITMLQIDISKELEQHNQKLEKAKAYAEQILAIEMLEYHNKNYLSGDNKSRSEEKQALLRELILYIK